MRIDFHNDQNPSFTVVTIEVDPQNVRGTRDAFGAAIGIPLQILPESREQPRLWEGELRWGNQGTGLHIPMQVVGLGTSQLIAPISDQQIASLEAWRRAQEPSFGIHLRAIGNSRTDGSTNFFTSYFVPTLMVPRDTWKRALEGLGTAPFRIVELPAAPKASDAWARASELVSIAAASISDGHYGQSIATSRTALERITEAVGALSGLPRNGKPFAPYVDELQAHLKRTEDKGDPLALIAATIRTAFAWTSEPIHQGFDVSERDDATFAVTLVVALYSYLAKATPPRSSPESQ